MHVVMIMALALVAQAPQSSTQFKNKTPNQRITVEVQCLDHVKCRSNQRRVLRPGRQEVSRSTQGDFGS